MKYLILLLLSALSVSAQSNAEIIAATLILEAGGEWADGAMYAVKEVLVNRAEQRGTTPVHEALRKKQFSCWNNVAIADGVAKAKRHPRWYLAIHIARSRDRTNYSRGADHYHALSVSPYWAKSMQKTVDIGNHRFYKSGR